MTERTACPLQDARKIVRDTRALMKGQNGDYVRGWRAALTQVESLIAIKIAHHKKAAVSTTECVKP